MPVIYVNVTQEHKYDVLLIAQASAFLSSISDVMRYLIAKEADQIKTRIDMVGAKKEGSND